VFIFFLPSSSDANHVSLADSLERREHLPTITAFFLAGKAARFAACFDLSQQVCGDVNREGAALIIGFLLY